MRILLADPPQLFLEGRGLTRQVQPLGLGYIGAVLAPHHDVRFLLPDTRAWIGDDPWAELRRTLAAEAPEVLGITAVTATYPAAARLAAEARAVAPDLVVVLGGVHASADPEGALRGAPDLDFVVQGEGEHTMVELVAALERDRAGFAPARVPGLVWREASSGQIHRALPRPPIPDLDALPLPKRDGLVWPEDVHDAFYQALVTLRGCPYRCIYCAVPSSTDRKTRYRSAAHVVDEIAYLREVHNVPSLFFHDSVFTLHRGRTVEICRLLIARGLVVPFNCQTRADRIDPELLDLMKEAGCQQIFFGIESGDAESLRRIRKKMDLDTIVRAVDLVKARDLRCTGFFMVGFPWEDETLIVQTADFATSIGLDAVSLFSATPLPGTELWELVANQPRASARLPESIDFRTPQVNLTRLSDDAYRQVFDQVAARVDTYNQRMMMERVDALRAGAAASPLPRRSWQD